jgi:hypothetical protein
MCPMHGAQKDGLIDMLFGIVCAAILQDDDEDYSDL